jgi:hypothetical protein
VISRGILERDERFGLVFFGLSEKMSEAIKASFPERTTVFDPASRHGKPFWLYAAGADSANLFGMHEATFFEDLQVLNDGG